MEAAWPEGRKPVFGFGSNSVRQLRGRPSAVSFFFKGLFLYIVLENLFGASQSLWPSGRKGDCGKCRQPEVVSLAFGSQIRSRGRWESHGISSQDSWSGLGLLFLGINRYPVPRHFYALLVKRVVEVVLLSSDFWLRLNINVPTFVCARDPRRAKQELGLRQAAVRGHRHVTGWTKLFGQMGTAQNYWTPTMDDWTIRNKQIWSKLLVPKLVPAFEPIAKAWSEKPFAASEQM